MIMIIELRWSQPKSSRFNNLKSFEKCIKTNFISQMFGTETVLLIRIVHKFWKVGRTEADFIFKVMDQLGRIGLFQGHGLIGPRD